MEEDIKSHGPLDGHAAKVLLLLEEMRLDPDVMDKCRKAVVASQREYRKWYGDNEPKVSEFTEKIRTLKKYLILIEIQHLYS